MSTLPEYFEETCQKPYDRHRYRLHYKSGKIEEIDDWMYVQAKWFNGSPFMSHIEVLD